MPAKSHKPEVGDKIIHRVEAFNVDLEATVKVLLSSQFIVHVTDPPALKGKDYFIFYSDDWHLKA